MSSTYSTNLALELIGTGDQAGTWGNTTNTNLGTLIEQAISGYVTQAVSTGTDTTITIPNGATGVARNMYIELTGTGGASTNLIVPANKKLYFIFNNASGAVTVKVSGQTGVSVPAGKKVVLASNGTDTVNALNYIADFGSNSATITQLTATSATITNLTLTSLVISNLSIASANITTLTAGSATITTLISTNQATIDGMAVGQGAGNVATNTAVGVSALAANTTGANNTAVGHTALDVNTEGSLNAAFGANSLGANTTGSENSAIGVSALAFNTTGANNVAVGRQALLSNTTASNNTAVGYQAGYSNTTGGQNTFIGWASGYSNTTGKITAVGAYTLYSNTTGQSNVAVGGNDGSVEAALQANTTGAYNMGFGIGALAKNTTASNNTAVGYQAGYSNQTRSSNTLVGYQAGYSKNAGDPIQAFGYQALYSNTSGEANNAFGVQALYSTTSGSYNTAFGSSALFSNTTASNNTAVGYQAGYSNITGISNVYIGESTGRNATGSGNTFIGQDAGYSVTTGANNTILGGYNGNQGGLDIRTSSNYIVLSDGDGNPRGYFDASGNFLVGTTNASPVVNNVAGINLQSAGVGQFSSDGNPGVQVNRKTNDGDLVVFRQDGTTEGTISVSGNTVSYNAFAGSHWSQLQDGSKPDILRGTVMESINELCVWPDENNERLPKSKVSDTAGSKKVYGVFMAWDNDWATTNDMYITAVGAFICRVNASVTVQEGDLLESNGDGTARVQADDIVRSSTIGKVTSTVKTHQYADGSYCVPTVLYCG